MWASLEQRFARAFSLMGAGVARGHQRMVDRYAAADASVSPAPLNAAAGTSARQARVIRPSLLDGRLGRAWSLMGAGVRRRQERSEALQRPAP